MWGFGIGMDSDQLMFCSQVLDTLFLFGQQKSSLKNSVTGQVTETEAIWFPFSITFPAYQARNWAHMFILMRIQAWCMKFNFWHSRAQLESGGKLTFIIMSTMILDSLDNFRIGQERSFWMMSFWSIVAWSCCKSRHLFLLFEGSRAPIFAQRWEIG